MKQMNIIDDITNYIFVKNEPKKSDVIFIPGSSHPELPAAAAELYHERYAPLVLPSGMYSIKSGKFAGGREKQEAYDKDYRTECEFYTDLLIKSGVPQNAILCEDKSTYTKENAFFSRELTDNKGITVNRAILCCQSFHARRALMYYQMAYPEAEFFVVPIDCQGISRNNWFTHEYGIDRVLGELSRCGNQLISEIKDYLN